MPDEKLPSPHSRFFQYSFSNIGLARDFLKSQLASRVLDYLDLSTLEIVTGSFIDDQLRESQSDLLFSVAPKQAMLDSLMVGSPPRFSRVLIYVLLEHKSHPDPMTPFQMLRCIWDERIRVELHELVERTARPARRTGR